MRNLFLTLIGLMLLSNTAFATTFYVDNVAGSDSNDGITILTPWSSLTKVNAGSYNPGDSILFKSGDLWRGLISNTANSSGSSGLPITYGAYGTGTAPIITGATLIGSSGWSVYSGNIYVKHGAITTPNQMYIDGNFVEPARFPASGFFSTTTASPDTVTVIDANLPTEISANDPVGGTVVLKTSNYSARSATISAYDSMSTLTVGAGFDSGYPYESSTGWGYYLRGKLWMLNAANQWFYDSAGQNLYVWTSTGDSPANHTVETSGQTGVVTLTGQNYITIDSLTVRYSNFYNIYTTNSTNITVNNVITYGGYSGTELTNCTSCTVQNSSILNSLRYGVHISGDSSITTGNTIANAGSMLISPDTFEPAGAYILGKNTTITHNTFTNSGYSAILQAGIVGDTTSGANLINEYNTMTNSCMLLADCGVDYTPRTELDQTTNGIIAYNVINHAPGNFNGTPTNSTTGPGANCFYLDVQQENFIVKNNQCSDANIGVVVNYGNNNTITGNAFRGMRFAATQFREVGANTSYGNILTGNVLESLGAYSLGYADGTSDHGNIAFTDYNTYCIPNATTSVLSWTSSSYSLANWLALTGKDIHSTEILTLCPNANPITGIMFTSHP